MIETDQVKPQKVRMAVAIVVLTEKPELWKTKEDIAVSLMNNSEDIEVLNTHTFGVPSSMDVAEAVRIEFDEVPKENDEANP